jgi:tRNA A37 threonylcarbamoyladenosine synthetase subunit TsaC/SUA5/YrdC
MPWVNKAVVFEDLFLVGLRMPSHLVLVEILQKFRVQLHQLTPNDIV